MIIASSAALTSNPPLLPRASLGITFVWYSAIPYSECEKGRSHKIKDVKRKPTFSAASKRLFCFFLSPFFFFLLFEIDSTTLDSFHVSDLSAGRDHWHRSTCVLFCRVREKLRILNRTKRGREGNELMSYDWVCAVRMNYGRVWLYHHRYIPSFLFLSVLLAPA